MGRVTWTAEQDRILTQLLVTKGYTRAVCHEAGAVLDRSAKSCENRARRLGCWPLLGEKSWSDEEDAVLLKALEAGGTSIAAFRSVAQQLPHRSWKACQQRAIRLGLYEHGFSAWTAERRQNLAEWIRHRGCSEDSVREFLENHELQIALESAIAVAKQLVGGALPPPNYYSVQEIATWVGVLPNAVYKRSATWPKLLQWKATVRSARVFWSIDALPPEWRQKIEAGLPDLPQPVPQDLQERVDRLAPLPRQVAEALLDSCAPKEFLERYLADPQAQKNYGRLAPHYREVALSIITYDYEAFGRYLLAAIAWAAAPAEVWPDTRSKALKDSDRVSRKYSQDPDFRGRRKQSYADWYQRRSKTTEKESSWKKSNAVFFEPKPKTIWW
jgi:hypothetical protein